MLLVMGREAWLLASGALAVTAAFAACGDDMPGTLAAPAATSSSTTTGQGGGTGGSGGGLSAECTAYGEAVCERLDACASFYIRVVYGDATRCAYRQALACEFHGAAPGSSFTHDVAADCALGYPNVACGSIFADVATECPYLAGTAADGEPCVSSWQCASASCQVTEPNGCGTCVPSLQVGAPCDGVLGVCTLGTACAGGVCQPLSPEGGSCAAGEPCDFFMACVNGVCSYGAGPGAGCDGANPCDFWSEGTFCSGAATCDPADVVGEGVACGDVGGVYSPCAASGKCSAASSTCVPPAEDAAACGGASEIGCYEPRRCIDGSCQLPDSASCGMAGSGGAGGA
jgi:hypothetical protein